LAVLAEVPRPLKITLQCSINKKVWEPLVHSLYVDLCTIAHTR